MTELRPDEWRSRRLLSFKKLWDQCKREKEDFLEHFESFERAIAAQTAVGPFAVRLTSIAKVTTGAQFADFWLQRRGTDENVGKPTYDSTYSQYNIGIRVKRPDIVVPEYLYYWFELLWMRGHWRRLNYGTLPLRHIRASDVCSLVVTFNP